VKVNLPAIHIKRTKETHTDPTGVPGWCIHTTGVNIKVLLLLQVFALKHNGIAHHGRVAMHDNSVF
jgi:hypothetical protein